MSRRYQLLVLVAVGVWCAAAVVLVGFDGIRGRREPTL